MERVNAARYDKYFSSAFQHAAIGMALVAPDGRWLMVNKSLCQLVGYAEDELLSKTFQDITHPDDLDDDLHYVQRMLAGEIETYQMEKRYFHKKGHTLYILLSVSLVLDEENKPLFFISQIQDITTRKLLEFELVKHATIDSLTGVNNRRRFFEFAERELVRGGRFLESMVVLMMDIDHFKNINDRYGHDVGDEVLKTAATTCSKALRAVDVFGRIGGEEFSALLVNTDATVGRQIAERLRRSIEKLTVLTPKGEVRFTLSIGAVAFTGGSLSLEYRMKQADEALYEAKRSGRNCVKIKMDFAELDDSFERAQTGFVRLIWKKSYECGNPVIDDQHKKLFELSNELLTALLSGQPKAVCRAYIEEMLSSVVEHFHDEEAIVRAAGFPLADEHGQIHGALAHAMEELFAKYAKGESSIGELFGFLAVDVVSKHMLNEDRKFFQYLDRQE